MTNKSGFDFSFSYDDNLTEKPNDPKSFLKVILQLEKEANSENDKKKKCKLLSKTGELYRIYGDYIKSEKYLSEALSLTDQSQNPQEYFIATFRLAHTFQKQKKFNVSTRLFNQLENMCNGNESLESYRDYLYQHIGKLNFDQEKYEEAMVYFEKAMELRKFKGDSGLIDSTELAIKITRSKLER